MSFSFNNKIRFSETGDNETLSIGKIIDYMQDCTNYHSESLGAGIGFQEETGRGWILNSWQIKICGDIKLGNTIQTTTWPSSFDKICGYRNYTMVNLEQPKEILIEADSTWVMMDMKRQRISRIEDSDIKMYDCEPPLSEELKKKKIVVGTNYTKQSPYIVRRYQLDINGHMNNSWYVKMAEEYILDIKKVGFVRVEYKKSAKKGDIIIPFVCYDENRCLVELRDKDEKIYAIVEFLLSQES